MEEKRNILYIVSIKIYIIYNWFNILGALASIYILYLLRHARKISQLQ
jgi:hypothetical protein